MSSLFKRFVCRTLALNFKEHLFHFILIKNKNKKENSLCKRINCKRSFVIGSCLMSKTYTQAPGVIQKWIPYLGTRLLQSGIPRSSQWGIISSFEVSSSMSSMWLFWGHMENNFFHNSYSHLTNFFFYGELTASLWTADVFPVVPSLPLEGDMTTGKKRLRFAG